MSDQVTFTDVTAPDRQLSSAEKWSRLRGDPVRREPDGRYLVTGYREVRQLFADPRMSVAPPSDPHTGGCPAHEGSDRSEPSVALTMQALDAPAHDSVRRHMMRSFGPPWRPTAVAELEPSIRAQTAAVLDRAGEHTRMDVVDDFTYHIPVATICAALGLPEEDEPRFAQWMAGLSSAGSAAETHAWFEEARRQMSEYLRDLIARRRSDPRDDMITQIVADENDGRAATEEEIVENIFLLFVGGHETTINTVASAILMLLRHPEALARLKAEPELVPAAFEEVLRLEPPAQYFDDRHALADIPVGGTVIPAGASVILVIAAANRDPRRFPDPDTFDIDRADNQHLSFAAGPHYCFGAPMARLEGRIMISEWVRRVENPRLVTDTPPYRRNPAIRGPEHLVVEYDGIRA